MFHAKRVECALLVIISGILHARPTYDILSSTSSIFGDDFDTNDKVSHVTQLAEEVTRF